MSVPPNVTCPPNFNTLLNCSVEKSYLRPDDGVTIIPWIYSLLLLLLHLPLAFLRIARWTNSQWLSVGMAFFSICLTCLSYFSTNWAGKEVYVWFPVALTGDISGAMQLIILFCIDSEYREYHGTKNKSMKFWIKYAFKFVVTSLRKLWRYMRCWEGRRQRTGEIEMHLLEPDVHSPGPNVGEEPENNPPRLSVRRVMGGFRPGLEQALSMIITHNIQDAINQPVVIEQSLNEQVDEPQYIPGPPTMISRGVYTGERDGIPDDVMPFSLLLVFLLSGMFLIILFVLQVIGLAYAIRRYLEHQTELASWCSPAFVLGGTMFAADCFNSTILPTDRGTGCVLVPGDQVSWLQWTFTALAIEIFLELLDGMMMLRIYWSRPWLTIFVGIVVWSVLIAVGIARTLMLPIAGHTVAIVDDSGVGCKTELFEGGLRGAIIAWTDGIFEGWDIVYFGPAGG